MALSQSLLSLEVLSAKAARHGAIQFIEGFGGGASTKS
jgi:hypothetical protein